MDERILALARRFGFADAAITSAAPTPPPDPNAHPQALRLTDDPQDVLPGAKSVLLLAMPYHPYRTRDGQASVDAYYVTSNIAHQQAGLFAAALREMGIRAIHTSSLRVKPLCVRAGVGRQGKNTLIAWGAFGSRVSIQTVLTDLECPVQKDEPPRLDDACLRCDACVRACPALALKDGALDIQKCVRAQPESDPLPEDMRPMTRGSVLGCDICQRVCPRNAAVQEEDMPPEMARALALEKLLSGEYKALIPFLGANNARKNRLMNRATLAAANLNRRDLIPLLDSLQAAEGAPGVHAAWAFGRLNETDGK